MIRGLSQPVESGGDTRNPGTGQVRVPPASVSDNKVIGVICSGDVAVHRDQVKAALERGVAQRPQAVWVCFEKKSDRMTYDVLLSLGVEPVVLPLLEWWRRKPRPVAGSWPCGRAWKKGEDGVWRLVDIPSFDFRRTWRDAEMSLLCDELIVFHRRTGNSPWRERLASGRYSKLFVVELGPEPKRPARKKRKPVGA